MIKSCLIIVALILLVSYAYPQNDSISGGDTSSIFNRLKKGIKDFKLDTATAPNDNITKKIIELRLLRGRFNITDIIDYNMQEDLRKKGAANPQLKEDYQFFKYGNGRRWLDNAVIWIYREHFTYKDLKRLVKFYKTSTGNKMAEEFPVIIAQSLSAAEMVKDIYSKNKQK